MPIKQSLNTFVKAGVIHDNDAFGFKAWNQCIFAPVIEYIAVNILLKVIKCKQHLFIQSPNNVGTFFSLPVVAIDTGFAYRCIAVRSHSFSLKAALIHINNGIALLLKTINLIFIYRYFDRTGFWML